MNLYASLFLFILLHTTASKKRCNGVYLNGKYYELNILREGINNIRHLAINRNSNVLYFSFDLLKSEPSTVVGYLNLNNDTVGIIEGVKNAKTVAVDEKNDVVYIGGETGVYLLNDRNVPIKTTVDNNVQKLFFLHNLYYTTTKQQSFSYSLIDLEIKIVNELQDLNVDSFIIDNSKNIFFLENNKLYRIQMGTKAVNSHEKYTVNALTTDLFGNAFVCASDGVYVFNKRNYGLDRVANLKNLKDLVFDHHNEPIYAVNDKIIKLKSSVIPCPE